jgi:hypothetical protein
VQRVSVLFCICDSTLLVHHLQLLSTDLRLTRQA